RGVLLDIDDTLTTDGRLTARAYAALEHLRAEGLLVVPITGRPAGWCDHIARMWPVDGVVGENGAFYFRYERARRHMRRRFVASAGERARLRARLAALGAEIIAAVPGAQLAADQPYRESDLAIDYREDVAPLDRGQVARIVELFHAAGANAKVSSIHVNGWFGDYDKLGMTCTMLRECFDMDPDRDRERFVFVGDSPNDAPMFAYFPCSVGVANVARFAAELSARPAYVTDAESGDGFAELADALIEARR
ncbi:MAG: HAD-IIB family hydrolase, partial [Gammaproteobacteria bacterium]|nr:HAD-IIB family hydrolase [Gammaproteobacteria bacterium]